MWRRGAELRRSQTQLSPGCIRRLFPCVPALENGKDVVTWRRGRAFQVGKDPEGRCAGHSGRVSPAGAAGCCRSGKDRVAGQTPEQTEELVFIGPPM